MYAQTLENIANWNTIGGQSIVGMMRENRNQSRLTLLGVSLDNNINDTLPYDQQKVLITNGTLPTGLPNPNSTGFVETPPATPVIIQEDITIRPIQPGVIDGNGDYVIDGVPLDIGLTNIPGSFGGSPYVNLIPPNLNSWYSSSTLMPSTYTVNEAIDEVIRCNCDCWNLA